MPTLPHVRLLLPLPIVLGTLLLAGCGGAEALPPQPVAFDHSKHAANDIGCLRCHQGADRAAQAGLPPLDTCASCHFGRIPDHPEVKKVLAAFEEKRPLRWVKVNLMPSSAMVHFDHQPHVTAGIDCAACHGDVASMTIARPVVDLADMGFCVDCHRERGASVGCVTCHH